MPQVVTLEKTKIEITGNTYVKEIIDSVVTPRKELFSMYKAGVFDKVKMGNNSLTIVRTKMWALEPMFTLVLKDLLHVSNLPMNLISTHALNL